MHFLDVGQGDAAILVCDGEAMIIDGGTADNSRLIYSYLQNTLHISRLKAVVATHPHADHVGGLSGALNACKNAVEVLLSPVPADDPRIPESRAWESLLKYGSDIYRVPQTGEVITLGSARAELLQVACEDEDVNNWSIILRVTYGSTSFLFTGDAEAGEEQVLLQRGAELRSTVLKVGHHGSSSSSTEAFIHAVQPQYAVISVGADNEYGHPTAAVLSRLERAGAAVWRTDRGGTVVCTSDGTTVTFSRDCEPAYTAPPETAAPSAAFFLAAFDWARYAPVIWFAAVNLIGLIASLIIALRRDRAVSGGIDTVQIVLAVAGGTVGVLLGMLLFERTMDEAHEQRMITTRAVLGCIAALQLMVILYAAGLHRQTVSVDLIRLFYRHKLLAGWIGLMNIAAFIAYCSLLPEKLFRKRRTRMTALLLLAAAGGAPLATVSVLILGQRRANRVYTVSLPLILLTQIVFLFFLANQRGM